MSKTERRKAEAALQALLATSDVLALLLAILLAYGLRLHSPLTTLVPVTKGVPSLRLYVEAALVAALAWVPTFAALGLYRPRLRLDFATQFEHGARAVGLGSLVLFAVSFFYRGASFSRLTLGLAVGLLLLLVPFGRVLAGRLAARFGSPSGLAVAGSGRTALELAARLAANPEPGVRLVGRYGDDAAAGSPAAAGSLAAVVEATRAGRVDRVLLALSLEEASSARGLIAALVPLQVELEWVPGLDGLVPGHSRPASVAGMPVLVLGEHPLLGWNGVVKRAMDLALSSFGLAVLAPFFLGLAVLIRATGPGPVVYWQERVGRDGRRFQMLKFRTMRVDAEEESGPIPARREDPRVTPIGRFLRRSSLDELPQLVNVWKGEMSLVGPRPERPCFIDDLAAEIPVYLERQRVKSGMTGWAQIHGLRGGDSSMAERVRCDNYYIENWSLGLDLRILVRTFASLHRQRNAY